MLEVSYSLATRKTFFLDLIASLSLAVKKKIEINDNKVVLPDIIGKGSFEFFELNEGIALFLIDGILLSDVKLNKNDIGNNEHFVLLFNLESTVKVIQSDGSPINLGNCLVNSVTFSSDSHPFSIVLPKHKPLKIVQVIFHRSWLNRYVGDNAEFLGTRTIRLSVRYSPILFTSNLTLSCMYLCQKLFDKNTAQRTSILFKEGVILELLAIYAKNLSEIEVGKDNMIKRKAEQLIQFVDYIKQHALNQIPSVISAAAHCNMSKSTFMQVFLTVYGKNYHAYFTEIRLMRAKQLLSEGHTSQEVADITGFNDVSYFSKTYRKWENNIGRHLVNYET